MGDLKLNGATSGTITVTPTAIAGTNTITLPASTGTVALTASPTFTGTVTATTVTSPSATALTIQSAGTTAMTVGTNQNIGIGGAVSSDTTYKWLTLTGPTTSGGGIVQVQNSDASVSANFFCNNLAGYIGTGTNHPLLFRVNATEIARFDTSGNLLVGTTSVNYVGSGLTVSTNSGTTKWLVGPYSGAATNFLISAASTFGVYLSGTSATSWSSLSDERTKDIIEPISEAVAKVTSLRAVIGSYKNDDAKKRRAFLIAQDVQKVLPEAVDSENLDNLGLAYTDVIPLLVAAIQELSAENDALEARLAALEAK